MKLNQLSPAAGSKKSAQRVGRGIGCGQGKTAGRGHKGQKSRSGGLQKVGFEGGQMPLYRRLPKVGFRSAKLREKGEVCLYHLDRVEGGVVDLESLRAAKLIGRRVQRVKLINTGQVKREYKVRGIGVTKGAREAIEAAGGKVE